jgi:hypothetical protein
VGVRHVLITDQYKKKQNWMMTIVDFWLTYIEIVHFLEDP